MSGTIIDGDCRDVLATMDAESVDAIVCDPPYELGFMGKAWDQSGVAFSSATWAACLRVLKPSGHLLAFGGTRTVHRIAVAIEGAGFDIRDQIYWLYGSGFPKSLDVSKAIDKAAGAEREVIGVSSVTGKRNGSMIDDGKGYTAGRVFQNAESIINHATAPATELARQWDGWGTALKPACEPIVVARKPLIGTVAANVTAYGTGALNIDATRIGFASDADEQFAKSYNQHGKWQSGEVNGYHGWDSRDAAGDWNPPGRWPANVVLDEAAGVLLDAMSGERPTGGLDYTGATAPTGNGITHGKMKTLAAGRGYSDTGGASRFFYCAKASRAERDIGLQCTCYNQAWERQDRKAVIRPETVTPRPRDTIESTSTADSAWRTSSNGSDITAPFLTDSKSITETLTSKTIESAISNCSITPPTSESIPDANSETASGGNLAEYAASESQSTPNTGISAETRGRSTDDASHVTSESSSPRNDGGDRCPKCGQVNRSSHPTVKPISLMQWLVRLVTPTGGLICDPFAGSGSTGIAAHREGFRFVGIELSPEYAEIARKRMAADTAVPRQLAMIGDRA